VGDMSYDKTPGPQMSGTPVDGANQYIRSPSAMQIVPEPPTVSGDHSPQSGTSQSQPDTSASPTYGSMSAEQSLATTPGKEDSLYSSMPSEAHSLSGTPGNRDSLYSSMPAKDGEEDGDGSSDSSSDSSSDENDSTTE
jgi:hypothetical protein